MPGKAFAFRVVTRRGRFGSDRALIPESLDRCYGPEDFLPALLIG